MADEVPVRVSQGSEALSSAEEQFRLSLQQRNPPNKAGLPLPAYEPPNESTLPPMQADLPGSQRSQLEAAVMERTKQLNRLFEDQVKKQYEAMRREVAKLAKAHQKDVQGLDARFKQKMSGMAARFKQLEEEEAKVRAIEAENADLMGEIAKLGGMLEEQEERYNASLKTIEEKDMAISQLSGKITDIKSQMTDAQREAEERTASMAAANEQMEQTVATLNATVTKKKEDLVSMQSRIVTAKSSYDHEMVRKQGEVHELEAALQQLHDYTAKMSRFTTQVQEQIRRLRQLVEACGFDLCVWDGAEG